MKILHVVGARPNFMKTAPIMAAMENHPDVFEQYLIHTGQHYDAGMSKVFLEDLGLPKPDEFLNVGSGSHAEQTARVMVAFEPVVLKMNPDWVFLVGDVNSTLACALVCAKLGIKVAHVEAGLRSGDRSMPEEINRIVTDQLSDLLFTPSRDADENLMKEGIGVSKIKFVGNVMIDTLVKMLPRASKMRIMEDLGLGRKGYILVTLHRPSNVDDAGTLSEICRALSGMSRICPVVFPVHPRTRQNLAALHIQDDMKDVKFMNPLGYLDFISLASSAKLVLTDSGGVQEETTFLNVPCLTVRPNTERPITIKMGTNQLVESRYDSIVNAIEKRLSQPVVRHEPPEFWDGFAARRIVDVFLKLQ